MRFRPRTASEDQVIFLEKAHFYHSIFSIPVSGRKDILPYGLINGQQLENLLSFYAWPGAEIDDFKMLPIPFSCLATDIASFKNIELKSGYLADAMRASSAVPKWRESELRLTIVLSENFMSPSWRICF